MTQNILFPVHMAPEEAFEQGHVISQKISTQQFKIGIIDVMIHFSICFLSLQMCAVQDKRQPFGVKLSIFCSCLTAASG